MKRLFFDFTDKHAHAWRKQMNHLATGLGTGDPSFNKDGTAINLFYRDLPRLFFDILTYLPVKDRNKCLRDIRETLTRIAKDAKQTAQYIGTVYR